MVIAWVGPLYWIQWAGGHRRLHPRGRRNGPGGVFRLPDCATGWQGAEPVRSVFEAARTISIWLKSDPLGRGVSSLLPRQLRAHRA
jgi:hypothetical protein